MSSSRSTEPRESSPSSGSCARSPAMAWWRSSPPRSPTTGATAAAKLGWDPVRAYDHEQAAVDATLENARNNGVELIAARASLRAELPKLAATVTANMTMPLLLEVAGRLDRKSLPRAVLCSG